MIWIKLFSLSAVPGRARLLSHVYSPWILSSNVIRYTFNTFLLFKSINSFTVHNESPIICYGLLF